MTTVGFIGLGLIGGSIAKSLKKNSSDIYIIAYNRSQERLRKAVEDKVVDLPLQNVSEEFSQCDIIFLCTPVEHNSTYLSQLRPIIKDTCIITDVGSVKGHIHSVVSELDMEACFIGGHPMAGSEKTGYEAATDILLENAYYAITPTKLTTQAQLDFYIDLVKKTGAIPVITEADIHDYSVAGISHVPHLIASSLVNLIRENDTDTQLMKQLAAGGFKDITRIASSSADMWTQICSTNAEQISLLLGKYIDNLIEVKNAIDIHNEQAIYDMFVQSKEYRDSINVKKGTSYNSYVIYCSIEDKEGALSGITTLLSDNNINIKNIEVIHNREYREGVLQIEFYDEAAKALAAELLVANNYSIHN